ncbi:MAG: sulfatase [Paenibacillus sp.]|jgi:phosphoglycerol transferase MdoB-like AlkP superfamily enzyme|nr:sulfatase [Paenibacillus sp.]
MRFKKTLPLRLAAWLAAISVIILLRASGSGTETVQLPVQLDTPIIQWTQEELNRNPNVIVVLSEAFWDPTQIEGLKFSRDPIPTYHALQEKYTNGKMLSPQFGGGTANVEFEVLTGNSMRFVEEDTIAYETVVKQDVDSLAGILSRQGYTSTSITPFHHWYFDSSNVYRRFGFSRYISLEFFNPNEYVGPYIGDHAVAKRIFEETKRSEGPDFIFANTMENHYHYWPSKFKRNTIDIKGNVPREALAILETYAQGASGADAMLQEVVEYFSQVKEPTILVFFGDHLPHLEEDYYVYRESRYIQGEDDPDFLQKMYNVPVLVWNNYLPEGKDELYISPSFLSPYILQLAKLKGSAYTDFLSKLSKRIPIIPPKPYYEAMQIRESDLTEYKDWQERILTGKGQGDADSRGYDESGEMNMPLTEAFTLGYGVPLIESVSPDVLHLQPVSKLAPDLLKTTITVKGGRFGLGCVLFANGKPLKTSWQTEEILSAVIPRNLLVKPGIVELQVKVIDEHEAVLVESNTFNLFIQDKQP